MNTGRSNKPLFEVLSQHPPRGTEAPVSRPEPAIRQPGTAPKNPTGSLAGDRDSAHTKPIPELQPTEQRSAESDPQPEAFSRPVVTIPLSTVYTAIAFAGALVLIAWIGGYQMGLGSALEKTIRSEDPPNILTEPSNQPGNAVQLPIQQPTIITQNPEDRTKSGANPVSSANPLSAQPSATGTILSSRGLLEADPREPGLNYLVLGSFTREMTQRAIDFLAANNLQVIGVPQPSGEYRLVSIGLGVPGGGQFSAMASQRVAHKRAIAEAGARWVREEQGGSDFTQSKTQWTKFQP